MLRDSIGLFCFLLMFSCTSHYKDKKQSSIFLDVVNTDSLLLDFKNETDSVKKIHKGNYLDTILINKKSFGKWASVKIELSDLYYFKFHDEKKSAKELATLAETNFHPSNDSLFNVLLCQAYVMHAYYLRNWHSQYFKAIQYCEKYLLNPFHKFIDDKYLAEVYKYLGSSYIRIGDKRSAMRYLGLAYERNLKIKDYEAAAGNCIDISIIFEDAGSIDSALSYLEKGLSLEFDYKERKVALLCTKASCLLKIKQFSKAEECIEMAYRLKIDNFESLAEIMASDARVKVKTGQNESAIRLFQQSAKEKYKADSTTKLREYGKIFNEIGDCFLKLVNYDSAQFYYHKSLRTVTVVDSLNIFSLPSREQLYAENTIMEALDAKAGIFQLLYKQKSDLKYLITAVQCYELSFEVEQKLMQYFSYDESKLLMLNESRLRSQAAINLCYQLYQLTKNNAWAEKAFEFAEKNKAFVLLESVKRNLASNIALQNDTLYQKSQSIQLQLAYNERSIAEAQTDADKKILLEQKDKLENELLFAKTALSRQSNAYRSIMEMEDSISAIQVSSGLLNEHTGLIEFFSADTVTYAFVISKNASVQFIKYPATLSDEIDSLLTFYSSSTAITNNPQAYEKTAFRLYSTLGLQQITKDWQNMIIIPDGKLCLLPFDALITEPSTTLNLQQAAYFIDQCNTVYGYSAKILIEQKGNITDQGGGIAVFAPVFTNRENNQLPLQYSYAEASSIGENNNARLFLKDKATLDNFKNQFARIGILHIATHAYADTGISNNSKIEFIDSSLLLNELYAMHTNASLIVLSACETGIGHLNKSEGSMSLARGFYYAGAKNVITSYWNVDDKSTASLFTSFYKEINTSSYSDALHNAKKKYIENATATSASPYYWAGFVHIGLPQKNKKSNIWWWWLLALPLIAAIYYRNKKRSLVIRNY